MQVGPRLPRRGHAPPRPGDVRVATARSSSVWEGGGEYNVARGLRRCFGLKTAIVTALADNPVGRLLEDLMLQGGVDQSHLRWVKYDGVGRTTRNGLNFTERGFGVRAALGCSDRGHTAVSQLKPGEIDWDEIFGKEGARWLHTGGIFCALSETTPEVCKEAMLAARKHGTIISYDLNYRDSLWKSIGGKARATEVNRELASGYVDVMIGNEEDFTAALGFQIEGVGEDLGELDSANFRKMIEPPSPPSPTSSAVATTLRHAKTASVNDWGAVCYYEGEVPRSPPHARPRNLRPRRRRRLLRLRPHLRLPQRERRGLGRQLRLRPRGARHDHPRRHHHGHLRRSPAHHEGRRRRSRTRRPRAPRMRPR
jgi:2-dehydro-3-deoxygluconokinase